LWPAILKATKLKNSEEDVSVPVAGTLFMKSCGLEWSEFLSNNFRLTLELAAHSLQIPIQGIQAFASAVSPVWCSTVLHA